MFSSTPATCAESIQFAGRFIMLTIEASVLNPMVNYPVVAKILERALVLRREHINT